MQEHSLLCASQVVLLTCMRAEELVLNHSCQGEAVKQVCQDLPYTSTAVLAQALLIEAIDLGVTGQQGTCKHFNQAFEVSVSKWHMLPSLSTLRQRHFNRGILGTQIEQHRGTIAASRADI